MRGTEGAPETGSENLRLTGRTTDGRTDGQWAKVVKMARAAEPLNHASPSRESAESAGGIARTPHFSLPTLEGLRTARIGSAARCQDGPSCLQDAMTPPRGPPRIAS